MSDLLVIAYPTAAAAAGSRRGRAVPRGRSKEFATQREASQFGWLDLAFRF